MTSWLQLDNYGELAKLNDVMADACDMDTPEALALITAAVNLTVAIDKFIALAEQLHPLAALRAKRTANQSGGPVGPT